MFFARYLQASLLCAVYGVFLGLTPIALPERVQKEAEALCSKLFSQQAGTGAIAVAALRLRCGNGCQGSTGYGRRPSGDDEEGRRRRLQEQWATRCGLPPQHPQTMQRPQAMHPPQPAHATSGGAGMFQQYPYGAAMAMMDHRTGMILYYPVNPYMMGQAGAAPVPNAGMMNMGMSGGMSGVPMTPFAPVHGAPVTHVQVPTQLTRSVSETSQDSRSSSPASMAGRVSPQHMHGSPPTPKLSYAEMVSGRSSPPSCPVRAQHAVDLSALQRRQFSPQQRGKRGGTELRFQCTPIQTPIRGASAVGNGSASSTIWATEAASPRWSAPVAAGKATSFQSAANGKDPWRPAGNGNTGAPRADTDDVNAKSNKTGGPRAPSPIELKNMANATWAIVEGSKKSSTQSHGNPLGGSLHREDV